MVHSKMNRLYTTDLKAVNHVLMNSYIYQKPAQARYQLEQILGKGVLVVEEDAHKKQVCSCRVSFTELSIVRQVQLT